MRVCLTGADGMLGSSLTEALAGHPHTQDWPVMGVSIRDFDIADPDAVNAAVRSFRPDIVIHTAANAIVDACETDVGSALRVNIQGTSNVAAVCRALDARLIYISSDYVFDGKAPPPHGYGEEDIPNPLSVYGLTKLGGERIVQTVPRHLSVRTSWLFGGNDERTDTVLATTHALLRGQRPRLISDQFSRPTYVSDLAGAVVRLLAADEEVTGVVHIANSGRASWYEVGQTIADELRRADVGVIGDPEPTPLSACGFVGGRPFDSTLATARFEGLVGPLPHWSDAVRRCFARLPLRDLLRGGPPLEADPR
jgi:dTDP-4-dehydrorhamnose reductase